MRSKSAKPITAICRPSLIHVPCFSFFYMYTYRCIQSISAGGCGNHGSPSEPGSQIHISLLFSSTIHNIHVPRTVPFLSASGMYGYFTSLSPSLCLVRRLSCSIISQMRGSHSQILMWLPCPELHASHHKPRPFAPSIRPRPRLVAVPLFPVSYMHIRETLSHPIHIDAPARFHPPVP